MKNKTFIATPITQVDLRLLLKEKMYHVTDHNGEEDTVKGGYIYLKPKEFTHILLEQPIPEGKSAEEIIKEAFKFKYHYTYSDEWLLDIVRITREDCASQLQPPKEKEYVLPSDELLRKAFEAGRDSEFDPDINATVFLYDTFDKWLSSLKE